MSGWAAAGLVLLALFLIGQIKVGVDARYNEAGALVQAAAGPLKLTVFPGKKKEKRRKKKRKKSEESGAAPEPQPDQQAPEEQNPEEKQPEKEPAKNPLDQLREWFPLIRDLLPLVFEAAGCFWSKLVVDRLELCLTVGSEDPADTAMLYGQAHAALGALWQPLTRIFHVKDGRAHVEVDFQASGPTLYGQAALSLKIGQILRLGLWFGWRALIRFLKFVWNRRKYKEERKAA